MLTVSCVCVALGWIALADASAHFSLLPFSSTGPRQSSSTGLMGPSPEPGSIWGLGMGALMPMGMGGGEEQGGQARAMNPRLPM